MFFHQMVLAAGFVLFFFFSFQHCIFKVCFNEAQITEVSRLKSSEFKN